MSKKRLNQKEITFYKMGDFYETFEEGAKIANKVLGLIVSERKERGKMAGVPYHSIFSYKEKLEKAGYKVNIIEKPPPRNIKK